MHVGALRGAGVRRSVLVFGVLLVHSLPEGFAMGPDNASQTEGLGLFVILAIALQNIPEGTSVAIPMEAAGFKPRQQFWAAVATSVRSRRSTDRLCTGRPDREPAADLVRLRRRGDAGPGRLRAGPRGFPPRLDGDRCRRGRWRATADACLAAVLGV